jgi:hypothetical protein
MTYSLVVVFLLTGRAYVEQAGLSLQACAGQAALHRQATDIPKLKKQIGEHRYLCIKESNPYG